MLKSGETEWDQEENLNTQNLSLGCPAKSDLHCFLLGKDIRRLGGLSRQLQGRGNRGLRVVCTMEVFCGTRCQLYGFDEGGYYKRKILDFKIYSCGFRYLIFPCPWRAETIRVFRR